MKTKKKKIWQQITKGTWCKGSLAKDEEGSEVMPKSSSAVKWCMVGWMSNVYDKSEYWRICKKLEALIAANCGSEKGLGPWNDKHTFRQVKALLKKADV